MYFGVHAYMLYIMAQQWKTSALPTQLIGQPIVHVKTYILKIESELMTTF